jgi:hypothetical protein
MAQRAANEAGRIVFVGSFGAGQDAAFEQQSHASGQRKEVQEKPRTMLVRSIPRG